MIDFRAASEALAELISQLGDDDLKRSTPCAEYTVADLVMHIDEGATGFTSVAGGATSNPPVADVDDETTRLRVAEHVRELARAWLRDDAWTGDSAVGGLELPSETWGKIALTEVVVHGWDLGVATGRRFAPPDHLVRACHDHVVVFVPDAPIPELWGGQVEIEAVSLLDRTVAVAGRDPRSWHLVPPS